MLKYLAASVSDLHDTHNLKTREGRTELCNKPVVIFYLKNAEQFTERYLYPSFSLISRFYLRTVRTHSGSGRDCFPY